MFYYFFHFYTGNLEIFNANLKHQLSKIVVPLFISGFPLTVKIQPTFVFRPKDALTAKAFKKRPYNREIWPSNWPNGNPDLGLKHLIT